MQYNDNQGATIMTHCPTLLSPGRIGTLELRNRIFQSAMGTDLASEDGTCGERIVSFYEARAAGGAALLTMGAVGVSYPRGRVQGHQVGISDDRFIPGLKRLTDAVHRHGARIAAQLHNGGICAVHDMIAGYPIWCASLPQGGAPHPADVMFPGERAVAPSSRITRAPIFKAMDADDIAELTRHFADGAARAVAAGFDAVEIHGAHGYIISSFLSPATNRRTDAYGGSQQNRARLLKEVIAAVRQRVGKDFPVWCKLDAAEFYVENGPTLDDVCTSARIAEAAGADAITVSASHNYALGKALASSYIPQQPGKLIPFAQRIKAAVRVPVITVGRIEPEVADKAIREGKFDFLAMGRKQIADPDFVRKLAQGGPRAVRPCIYCYACLSQAMLNQPLRCAVNADVGFETDNLLAPAETPRRVVVVGGGPAGMEAARRLTLRGHRVTLLEATGQLGGTARIAAIVYQPNGDFVEWLKDRLSELAIDVRLNTTATIEGIGPWLPMPWSWRSVRSAVRRPFREPTCPTCTMAYRCAPCCWAKAMTAPGPKHRPCNGSRPAPHARSVSRTARTWCAGQASSGCRSATRSSSSAASWSAWNWRSSSTNGAAA
jgi:2,4-dienoyl-CoA reductase-like NADH-dependent reductase (Old Yellow Enzyme family)